MARGSQNGISNNPKGKPTGAVTKITLSVREKIVEKVTDDLDNYFNELKQLTGKDYVKCFTELLKLVVPRPLNEEETSAFNINSELIKKLFSRE